MGGEFLEVFDRASGERVAQIDLGYAVPRYPATTMEAGEYFYATAKWANDGRKACTSCHVDRFLTDGVGFSNGATAPTAFHQVKPNYNLMSTDNFFWNGSFRNNSYASLAFAAQSRTNCELILFGLVEGPDSDPATRVGDPLTITAGDGDENCKPDSGDVANGLPAPLVKQDLNGDGVVDFADIQTVIANQKAIAFDAIGLALQEQLERIGQFDPDDGKANRDAVSRAMDFYGAAELRLPPNPVAQMAALKMLGKPTLDRLSEGKALFASAGCATCHDPDNQRAPFTDGKDHGRGADFVDRFITEYSGDSRLLDVPNFDGVFPQALLDTQDTEGSDVEVNYHYPKLDFFEPFCFDQALCLVFDNPLSAARGSAEEAERLFRLIAINIADPDRGFIPGQVLGEPSVNTPSLRGLWLQHNLLRHGRALSFREAILAPGHKALRSGELGYAIDTSLEIDVHGATSELTEAQIEALVLYLWSIE